MFEHLGQRSRSPGRGGSIRVSRAQCTTNYLNERDGYFWIPHCTQCFFRDFVMDGYSQAEIDRLFCIRLTPGQIRRSVILGLTFKNGPRMIMKRYQDAMACDQIRCGKPLLFITVSCNPKWLEIKDALGPNDKACKRPDHLARVYEAKLNRLCDNILGTKLRRPFWRNKA
ncbi:BQ5605_C025g09961 [Microbotryum silenes-dioicae]|uniref:BQ5605_C025g09961 protein n=1 Tax=Microbotryum silenes-dioicae TaxID=796604 RepID=A0A2X0PME2_9BASI|nr:BQ5605_C025g09961 [Microbotryum silenes-dioicae]